MTKLRLASAARPALMLVVEGPPWTSSALVSGPNSQNCAREVRLAVVLSYYKLKLVAQPRTYLTVGRAPSPL